MNIKISETNSTENYNLSPQMTIAKSQNFLFIQFVVSKSLNTFNIARSLDFGVNVIMIRFKQYV